LDFSGDDVGLAWMNVDLSIEISRWVRHVSPLRRLTFTISHATISVKSG
jgi:hypothetical protein